jgi:exosortase
MSPPSHGPRRRRYPLWWVGACALGAVCVWSYWPTLEHLTDRWWHDPQASHGFIVPILALLVLWSRKQTFPTDSIQPAFWGVGVIGGAALLRLLGVYFYLDWFDGLSMLVTLTGVTALVGGFPLLRWSWPALVVLLFLLPLPYGLEIALGAPLQRLATLAGTYTLQTLGFPAVSEGNIIVLDDYQIGVMEACNGLGMLVAFFALSTTVALIAQRPLSDRLVIFFSAIPIGVLMNLLRIAATGVAFPLFGRHVADTIFHDLAGWLMMPLALATLWLELQFLSHLFVTRASCGPIPVPFTRAPLPIPDRTCSASPVPAPVRAASQPS